ncbi:hypothetical protein KC730_02995, partial [Candidatus Kaiserbacteria bacterium]|nr:hypothetical protein [Candidatus Kaiserbacteria bacterium]
LIEIVQEKYVVYLSLAQYLFAQNKSQYVRKLLDAKTFTPAETATFLNVINSYVKNVFANLSNPGNDEYGELLKLICFLGESNKYLLISKDVRVHLKRHPVDEATERATLESSLLELIDTALKDLQPQAAKPDYGYHIR